jgi:hypothetical protein
MNSPNFFSELKRRNVYKVAVAKVASFARTDWQCSTHIVTK